MSRGGNVLLATTIFVRQEDGTRKQYHQGEVVPGLDAEQVDRLTKCGALGTASDLEEVTPLPADRADDTTSEAEADVLAKPERDASKPDLVTWVVENLVHDDESPYTKSEANRLNKDELWDLIDGAAEEG